MVSSVFSNGKYRPKKKKTCNVCVNVNVRRISHSMSNTRAVCLHWFDFDKKDYRFYFERSLQNNDIQTKEISPR